MESNGKERKLTRMTGQERKAVEGRRGEECKQKNTRKKKYETKQRT